MKSKFLLIIIVIALIISSSTGKVWAIGLSLQYQPNYFIGPDRSVMIFFETKNKLRIGMLWQSISAYLSERYIGSDSRYLNSGNLYAIYFDNTYGYSVLNGFKTFSCFKLGRAAYSGPMFSEMQYFWSFVFGLRYKYTLQYGEIGLDIPCEIGSSFFARNMLDAYISFFSGVFINIPIVAYYSFYF